MYHQSYKGNLLGDGKTNRVPNTLPFPKLPNHLLFYLPANSSVLPQYLQGGRWEQIKTPNARLLPPRGFPARTEGLGNTGEGEKLAVPCAGPSKSSAA